MDEKSKKYINIFYFIIFITLIISFVFYKNSFLEKNKLKINNENEIRRIKINNKIYKVEIRDTAEGRNQGLSNTKHDYLCDSCALLFVWDSEAERTIWMKDMNYPIDIYWMNKDMQIIHSEYNVATSTYNKINPRDSIIFGKGIYNVQYALETKVK